MTWKTVKLGDVTEVQNGYAFKSKDFCDVGIPVIKIKNIASGKLKMSDVQYYNGPSVEVNENAVGDFIAMYPQRFTEIEYQDCRGIVLGAIDYAENLGLEPHKDWQKVEGFIESEKPYETRHKFGKNGKPFYVEGPDDDIDKINQILMQHNA